MDNVLTIALSQSPTLAIAFFLATFALLIWAFSE